MQIKVPVKISSESYTVHSDETFLPAENLLHPLMQRFLSTLHIPQLFAMMSSHFEEASENMRVPRIRGAHCIIQVKYTRNGGSNSKVLSLKCSVSSKDFCLVCMLQKVNFINLSSFLSLVTKVKTN